MNMQMQMRNICSDVMLSRFLGSQL